jgi:hypothetical protein
MLIRGAISELLDIDIKARMIHSVPDLLYSGVADVGHAAIMLIEDLVTEALENFLLP